MTRRPSVSESPAAQAREVGPVDDALMRLIAPRVPRDDGGAIEDYELAVTDEDFDPTADEAMRHAVANGVDVDKAVRRDAAILSTLPHRDGTCRQRPQRRGLARVEACARRLVGRA